jgi:hypothetical protein
MVAMGPARRKLVALVIPAFIVAHLLCICSQAVATQPSTYAAPQKAAGHDCCRGKGEPKNSHEGQPGCAHCHSVQLSAPDATRVPLPSLVSQPVVFVTALMLPPGGSRAAVQSQFARGGHAPPSVLRLKCTLLI